MGSRYALFHTCCFRLPRNRPLVRRLWAFFDVFERFLGPMPEDLGRYLFNPHWTAEGDARVAETMLDRLRARGMLPSPRSRRMAEVPPVDQIVGAGGKDSLTRLKPVVEG